METLTISVNNVKCGGCVSNIRDNLSTIQGIDSIEVDIASGCVTITGTQPDKQVIEAKLNELGYPPVSQ